MNLKPTDVGALLAEIDAGMFEQELAMALSMVANGCIEHEAAGDVTIKFKCKPSGGGTQLSLAHTLTYTYPDGKRAKQVSVPGTTVMVVNDTGTMSLFPESQLGLDLSPSPRDA